MSTEEIRAYADTLYKEAEQSLGEAIRNNQPADTQFWRGYREAAERICRKVLE